MNLGVSVLFLMAILAGPLQAQVEPDRSGLGQAEFKLGELDINNDFRLPADLPSNAGPDAVTDLGALGLSANAGMVDIRSGRWARLLLAEPMLPGGGKGNNLSWSGLGKNAPKNDAELSKAASEAFRDFIEVASSEFRVNSAEMANPGKVTIHGNGHTIQIYVPRVFNGIKVRDSYLTATINNGNMTVFGANNWGDINTSIVPQVSESTALETVQLHAGGYTINGAWRATELQLIPVARGQNTKQMAVGQGYDYRLAWIIRPAFDAEMRRFEALVDAHNGELLSFVDTNQYADVKGGVLPVSNDGIVPDGVEQAGWPMPFADVGAETTDTGGNFTNNGTVTTDFFGPYININDQCGTSSLTGSGVLDWGTSGGTDCTTPGFGGAGNTHASRTGFYELNKVIEMARGQLPGNTWLESRLISNMNINNTCNAFWNGTVNFYRSGGGCFNTGEIAGVFDHEWGHGMDANDATPGIASPSGEGIADIYTALRLNTSCIGRNFRATVCTGFGDPCLTCTGVRDIDYLKRQSGQPHDYSWSNANCGGSVHCVGAVYAEAVWSLWKRELQQTPYNYDNNTAQEIVTRLTFVGAGATGTWFSGGPPNGGCGGSSGYMNFLAADDDNGNLNDGTPHMTAIFNAFNDQEIACGTPTVQDSGCANNPASAPVVTATPLDKSVSLSWGAVTDATGYEVFRTEGVFACDFGKVKLGETAGTSWNDPGLNNGRSYSYVVIPKGAAASCFGPASACATSIPVSGPNLDVDPSSSALAINTGDGDSFIDNCEDATLTFDVNNTGAGSLTNVRITGVTAISHPATTVSTTLPAAVSPSTLAQGATGTGSFDFHAEGLAFGDTLIFEISVTSDEISPAVKTQSVSITNAESDLQSSASKTWDFETDLDGWTLIQGTFNRASAGGGAGGSSWYARTSSNLDNQCDQIRSPAMRLTATSTIEVFTNFDIENQSSATQWWDRANVAFFEGGSRNSVDPDSGRAYNASGSGATCVTVGQNGWAASQPTWASSGFSATALNSAGRAGSTVQIDVAYGTDVSVVGDGFRFDQVTVTNIEELVADGQSDVCDTSCTADPECNDGTFCNGTETCNLSTGLCEAGTPPSCDDLVSCTVDSCNVGTDACDNVANDVLCPDDGLFCTGTEFCDPILSCLSTGDPCSGETCDEGGDVCVPPVCNNNGTCEADEDCGNCPADCPSFPIGGAGPNNNVCEAGDGETCYNTSDCNGKTSGKPAGRFCCGIDANESTPYAPDGCGSGSTCNSSGNTCTTVPVGGGGSTCCGDGTCQSPEDSFNCEIDCGPAPVCGGKGDACSIGTDCCSGQCKNNGTCR